MEMSPPAIEALVKPFEGCKLSAYICPANRCTIGWGHTSEAGPPEVKMGMIITQQQADEILARDLQKFERAVTRLVKQPLTQNQFDVLVDFSYNAGEKALERSSLLRKVNAAKFDDVPAELMKWTRGGPDKKILPGLVRRRQAEIAWWNADEAMSNDESRLTPEPVIERTMAQSKQGNAALVTAGLGSLGAVNEAVSQVQAATDTANNVFNLLKTPNFLIMSTIIILALAIWWFRKRHMEKYGV